MKTLSWFLLTFFLVLTTSFADGVVGMGNFNAEGEIGDLQVRGVVYNVSYAGTGVYEVTFNAELDSVENYVAIPTGWKSQETRVCDVDRQSKGLQGFTISCKDGEGNAADPKNIQFAVFYLAE
jgi:hypothetical protein